MSQLTDLIARAKAKDPKLAADLEREFKALSSRLSFGLNFERHRPEAVELPQRPVRKGDKVRLLPERGSTAKGDRRLWRVTKLVKDRSENRADLERLDEPREHITAPVADLVVVAEFRDTIYPGLVSTGRVSRGDDKPWHTVINGENYHALKALTWTHRGKIDAIYIDPPYNTGAKDWKYNNDYVENDDLYRHSKWLAMMERRLQIARELLKPTDSVLIVTIDEKEYLRLGLLLEQVFPEARTQMVSITISPRGTSRANEFSRIDEYAFYVFLGRAGVEPATTGKSSGQKAARWQYLRRDERTSTREAGRPKQFFPIFIDQESGVIRGVGEPLEASVSRKSVRVPNGTVAVFPVREDGTEMVWGLTAPTLRKLILDGFVRVSPSDNPHQPWTLTYLRGVYKNLETGKYAVVGEREDGSKIVVMPDGKISRPTTVWRASAHDAGAYGTSMLREMIPGRHFPFPKSLYAVEDSLRYIIRRKRHAVVLDFFAGSGTTAHAILRLNRQDGGSRQCISVTNNEVGADEQKALRKQELRPGDASWEHLGICHYITNPRIEAAITGKTPDGEPIKGDYKFTDEFPMSDGFEENAEFFTLTYETPIGVSYQTAFARVAPLLWMRAGSAGQRIDKVPSAGWAVADTYGLLIDLDKATEFLKAVRKAEDLRIVYIVTDDERRFQALSRRLPEGVEAIRLYESYLTNFAFTNGDVP